MSVNATRCPSCDHALSLRALVPDEQKMGLTLHLAPGQEAIAANTLGGVMSQTATLLKSVARNLGGTVEVFVSNVAFAGRDIAVEFVILDAHGHAARSVAKAIKADKDLRKRAAR